MSVIQCQVRTCRCLCVSVRSGPAGVCDSVSGPDLQVSVCQCQVRTCRCLCVSVRFVPAGSCLEISIFYWLDLPALDTGLLQTTELLGVLLFGWLFGWLVVSVSRGPICSDSCTCCRSEIKLAVGPSHSIATTGQPVPALPYNTRPLEYQF